MLLGCQRSVLVSIHSCRIPLPPAEGAVKDLCWCQSTAHAAGAAHQHELSKICAGVNPQLLAAIEDYLACCQRSVLVSIHSGMTSPEDSTAAVKDLCWCQSTAWNCRHRMRYMLSKICAGVNPQLTRHPSPPPSRCQRSVLVSIHSTPAGSGYGPHAVKDLCWCQSTATLSTPRSPTTLSKICAGVNPQQACR